MCSKFILLLSFAVLPFVSYAQRFGCNNEIFRVSYVTGQKKSYPLVTLERSLRRQAFGISIGGGYMGLDEHYLSPQNINSYKIKRAVVDSKTIDVASEQLKPHSYLERTRTEYHGVMLKASYVYYFKRPDCGNNMRGLYTGVALSGIKTFEFQTLTYRQASPNGSYEISGTNVFYTLGIELKTGYNWFPFRNSNFCVSGEISHPFYIPFTKEINTYGPFTAGRWELSAGIGWRVRVR